MKRLHRPFAALLLALSLIFAQASPLSTFAHTSESISVIVKLKDSIQTDAAIERIKAAMPELETEYEYSLLFNGFCAEINSDRVDILKALPDVEGVFADTEYTPLSAEESELKIVYDPSVTPDSDPTRGAGAVVAVLDDGFNVRHETFKLGDSSSIAIIPEDITELIHFTKAKRLYNYTTIKYVYKSEKIPFAFDYAERDTDVSSSSNHGTAMLSLAAGYSPDGTLTSAAPAAQALAMKICEDKTNTAKTSAIVAALEDAYLLGADSVCLSLGSPCGFSESGLYDSLLEETIAKLYDLGVTVVCAAGNDSALGKGSIFDRYYGYYEPLTTMPDNGTVSAPSTVPSALSAASADTFIGRAYAFSLYGTDIYIPYSDSNPNTEITEGKPFNRIFDKRVLEYVPISGLGKPEDFVTDGKETDLTGKLALIKRGEISFVEKVNNAAARGAAAVIVYDSKESDTPSIRTAMQLDGAMIPAVFISKSDGEAMISAKEKKIFIDSEVIYVTDAGITPSPSEFTSRGPTPTLDIKPELAASGTDMTVASANGSYSTMSGTSVSAAFTAGVAARIACKLGHLDGRNKSETVKTILMNTASPMADIDDGKYRYYSVTLQGAGYIAPLTASNAELAVRSSDVGKIQLGNNISESFEMKFSVENLTDKPQSLNLSAVIGTESFETLSYGELCSIKDSFTEENGELMYEYLGKNENDLISFTGNYIHELKGASVTYEGAEVNKNATAFTGATLSLKPYETREITLSAKLDKNELDALKEVFENGMYIEGYVFLENSISYSVPFLGFYGDFYAIDPFDSILYENGGIFGGVYLYTYYADEFKDYTVPLGTNYLTTGMRTRPSLMSELNVLSPIAEGADGAVFVRAVLLRNLKSLKAEVYTKDGDYIGSAAKMTNLKKAYTGESKSAFNTYAFKLWECRDSENPSYIHDDGQYVCKLTGTDAAGNTFTHEIDFTVDSEKPTLVSHEIRQEDGESYLDVTVRDNSFIKSVHAYAFNNRELDPITSNIPTDNELAEAGVGGEFTVSFDITNMSGQNVYVKIYDIAYNFSLERISV